MKDRDGLPYKVLVMFKYVKEWGWSGKEIQALDNFEEWDYNRTMVFWNMVKKFMLLSYQKIATQLPAMKLEQKISESDFKLLSGKIKSHFVQRAEQDRPLHHLQGYAPRVGAVHRSNRRQRARFRHVEPS